MDPPLRRLVLARKFGEGVRLRFGDMEATVVIHKSHVRDGLKVTIEATDAVWVSRLELPPIAQDPRSPPQPIRVRRGGD